MKALKFTDAQTAFIIKQGEDAGCRYLSEGRDQPSDLLQLEEKVCGPAAE